MEFYYTSEICKFLSVYLYMFINAAQWGKNEWWKQVIIKAANIWHFSAVKMMQVNKPTLDSVYFYFETCYLSGRAIETCQRADV